MVLSSKRENFHRILFTFRDICKYMTSNDILRLLVYSRKLSRESQLTQSLLPQPTGRESEIE